MRLAYTKILILVENNFEDIELLYPRYRFLEEGAKVVVAGPEASKTYRGKHGNECKADIATKEIRESDFDALFIPGGYAPDKMRMDTMVLEAVKQFNKKGKLIAYICHAGWVLASADILKGIQCTSYWSIKDDLVHAGAKWIDQPVVIDHHIISSRCPDDLPYLCPAIIECLEEQSVSQNGKREAKSGRKSKAGSGAR